ncbi:MAG TPA: class I SAM-dependent methyltransferase [Ktedonobacteraceae bacterium]|jgi:ubiquinone/menaquinone biosynthesis C-methylase UbiE|nr:class I SAM-dependent methyltransferase [Ktedonobacteraceae bacterium]
MAQSEDENRYFIDHESGAEMARLLDQDRTFTRAMGGLLVERDDDFTGIERVLDVGCGPGGWVQEVAFAHPKIEVVGIDLSKTMLAYARAQAQVQHLDNALFQEMDIQQPLEFPDDSFDLVNARLLGFFPSSFWPTLVQEYVRVARPGGLIRLTETEMSVSNSPALEQEMDWFFRALWKAGMSFSPNGHRLTVTAMLAPLLRQAGCRNVRVKAHGLDWSAGAEAHRSMGKDMQMGFKLMEPFYLTTGVASQEELERTYEQMLIEIQQDTFGGIHYLLTAYGEKL